MNEYNQRRIVLSVFKYYTVGLTLASGTYVWYHTHNITTTVQAMSGVALCFVPMMLLEELDLKEQERKNRNGNPR